MSAVVSLRTWITDHIHGHLHQQHGRGRGTRQHVSVIVLYNRVPVKIILDVVCRKGATYVEIGGRHHVRLVHYSVVP